GQRDPLEVARVLAAVVDRGGDLGLAHPQPHAPACAREVGGERRAPGAAAHYRDVRGVVRHGFARARPSRPSVPLAIRRRLARCFHAMRSARAVAVAATACGAPEIQARAASPSAPATEATET